MRRLLLAAAIMTMPLTAQASEAGVASGHYADDDQDFAFTHAVVLRQDDAEKVRDGGPGLRVLLSDIEVGVDAIEGGVFPPVHALAKAGRLHGLLLDFDPANPTIVKVVVLANRADGFGLATISLEKSDGLWSKLEIKDGRVVAALKPEAKMSFSFAAPILEDPIREELRGAAARRHPLIAMLQRRAEAFRRGDLAAATTDHSKRQADEMASVPSAQLVALLRQQAPMLLADIGRIDRLIVRGNIATAMQPDGSAYSFVREDGAWKID